MTFNPQFGLWSEEAFDTTEGATFSNQSLQSITGGHITLLPSREQSTSYYKGWHQISGWSFTNSLQSKTIITGDFALATGIVVAGHQATQTGYQKPIFNAGAWEISTSRPTYISGYGYSGAIGQSIVLNGASQSSDWFDFFDIGGTAATIEIDLVSLHDIFSGQDNLVGFQTGQQNLTGLPSLTGVRNHGIYLSTTTAWDYIEVNPYGIRSVTHPEIALPIDLTTPKRVRIGLQGANIYLSTDDGKSIAGIGKFNNVSVGGSPALVLGAPLYSGVGYVDMFAENIGPIVGTTQWHDIKILYGQMVMHVPTGLSSIYSTSSVSMTTAAFDPTIGINNFVSAAIGFKPFREGNTTVTAQYSGLTGWTNSSVSQNLLNQVSPLYLDLNSIPTYSYPRQDLGNNSTSNPIRFKVEQQSFNGVGLPPAIDYIQVVASSEGSYLDLLPNWKPKIESAKIQVGIQTGVFIGADPKPSLWTSLLLNTPNTTGVLAEGSTIIDQSKSGLLLYVTGGLGEIVDAGPYGYSFQNYNVGYKTATSGSEAFDIFGLTPQQNFFPNPLIESFRPITTGEPQYVSGKVLGEIADDIYLPLNYTGRASLNLSKTEVYRPDSQSRVQKINTYLGRSQTPVVEYVQTVEVVAGSSGTLDNTVGIEARIPSGIATGSMLLSVDIQIPEGDGITIYATGAGIASTPYWNIYGSLFRQYRSISFPITSTTNDSIRVGFVGLSGSSVSAEKIIYNIDNITLESISSSYLNVTGVIPYLHLSGVINDNTVFSTVPSPRASTIFHTSLYLDSYPSSNSGVLFKATGQGGKGFELNISSNGLLNAIVDHESQSWAPNAVSQPNTQTLSQKTFSSIDKVPLGRWTDIGFIHQTHTSDKLTTTHHSGEVYPLNFALSNRCYLTIDGYPTQSVDMMDEFLTYKSTLGDTAPWLSYIPLSGNIRAIVSSGLYCKVDGLHLSRPPIGECEVDLSIKGSRASPPYFVPDSLFKGNANDAASCPVSNLLLDSTYVTSLGKDIFLGSCYNFCGPAYTHWDHGMYRNHLLYDGTVIKETGNPYNDPELNSTRFLSGSIGTATYSSSLDRIMSFTGQLEISSILSSTIYTNVGRFRSFGWIYPRTTGVFFRVVEDSTVPQRARFQLQINSSGHYEFEKYAVGEYVTFSSTGSSQVSYNAWNFIYLEYTFGLGTSIHMTDSDPSIISVLMADSSGIISYATGSGQDFGFKYRGNTLDNQTSDISFGCGSDINFFNWVIDSPPASYITDLSPTLNGVETPLYSSLDKGGRHQTLVQGFSGCTGISWVGFNKGTFNLLPSSTATEKVYWVAAHNAYDNNAKLNGGVLLYDNEPFKEVEAYYIQYDTSSIETTFGATDSPIRIGNVVPPGAINLARISNPEYTVPATINTIDLAESNINNLVSFREGAYSFTRNNGSVSATTASGYYKGINSDYRTGRADVVFSGALISDNVQITSLSAASPKLASPEEAYYYYLLGRGKFGVQIPDAYPHPTGQITLTTTGSVVDSYLSNLSSVRNSISLKTSDGEPLSIQTFPYDIIISPFNTSTLESYVLSGLSLPVDGLATGDYSSRLPDGVFSVVLLTAKSRVSPKTSVWAYYNSYDYNTKQIDPSHREVVTPMPIMRQSLNTEVAEAGRYNVAIDSNSNAAYNLTIYGIAGSVSGKL